MKYSLQKLCAAINFIVPSLLFGNNSRITHFELNTFSSTHSSSINRSWTYTDIAYVYEKPCFSIMHRINTTLLFLFLSTTSLFAATINVPGDQPTIANAVSVANSGDVIILAPGTYVVPERKSIKLSEAHKMLTQTAY